MVRIPLFAALLACCSIALADEPQPIEIQFVVIELSSDELREAGQESGPTTLHLGKFESDEWMDEVIRLRTEGSEVRVQRLTVTAHDALSTHVEMFSDHSVSDDERNDGERDQAVLDVNCVSRKRDDGRYSLEFSIRDEDRNDVSWEQPLLDLGPPPRSSGPPSDTSATTSTILARADEWICVGAGTSSSTEPIGGNQAREQKTTSIVLLRVVE